MARRSVLVLLVLVLAVLSGCGADQIPAPRQAATAAPATLPAGLPELVVAEPDGSRPRYERDQWDGRGWADVDGDGCNTRAEVLQLESAVPTTSKATTCTVVTGSWSDPYTGRSTTLAADLQIDHLVALGDAHRSGGWAWSAERKREFANDLSDPWALNAVWGQENERKADHGPDEWLPISDFRCTYVLAYATVKARWGLTVSPAQYAAIAGAYSEC